ncbi:hypothetical protein ACWN8V_07025 [Vagococcus elongatus]|uniref:Uncharacterized protein n=1 Tax=Vagococcus elongatus TaxID=180344 RepID=A0A430AW58_9ENTE|nr:hypothetical protein [Vagococcus elongatus]RSU12285.1 hypothetical protein CBF29_06705 [Vagococcus elongatus]
MSREDILKIIEDRKVTVEIMGRQIKHAYKIEEIDTCHNERTAAVKELYKLEEFLSMFDKYIKEVRENDESEMIEAAEESFGM